jgi:hypothetical protein
MIPIAFRGGLYVRLNRLQIARRWDLVQTGRLAKVLVVQVVTESNWELPASEHTAGAATCALHPVDFVGYVVKAWRLASTWGGVCGTLNPLSDRTCDGETAVLTKVVAHSLDLGGSKVFCCG